MLDKEAHKFPCPSCGSDLRYAPGSTNLSCDHCGYEEEIGVVEGVTLREINLNEGLSQASKAVEFEETRVAQCSGCNAKIEFDPNVHAKECPYCATPIVTDTGADRHIKPAGLLPFTLNEEGARDAMTKWLGKIWFAPNGLKDYAKKGRKLNGIYVPFWTYDAETQTRYTGQKGTVYHVNKTVEVNGKMETRSEAKVRWRHVSGQVRRFFDDVLILASKSLPRKHTDALQPWDLKAILPYNPSFVAGFRAEAYQIDLAEGFQEAREVMDKIIERDIRHDIGGDKQRIQSKNTEIWDVTFKHILLPIWVAAYQYKGKSYRFVVNAQTGRVQGERPYSFWKIAFAVMLGLIAAGIVAYIVAKNQGKI